jgi:hypothetical protein
LTAADRVLESMLGEEDKEAKSQTWQYLTVWIFGTCCLIALATLVWGEPRPMLPPDVNRLRVLLLLVALATMPLGRLSLASMTLARNRHR